MKRILVCIFAFWSACAAAAELRFVEEGNWPPFTTTKEGLATDGFSYEMITEIGRRAGFTSTLTLMPQKRLEYELAQGSFDAVTVISRNAAREAYLDFSEPLFKKLGNVYHRSGTAFTWKTYADFKDLRIGVTRGHNLGEEFNQAVKQYGLSVDEGGSDEQNFMKLVANRVDIVLANHWTALFLLRQPRFVGLVSVAAKPFLAKDYHMGITKSSATGQKMLPVINRTIRAMKADGSLDAMLIDHLNPERGKR